MTLPAALLRRVTFKWCSACNRRDAAHIDGVCTMAHTHCTCQLSEYPPVIVQQDDCPRHGIGTPFRERTAAHARRIAEGLDG